MRISSDFFRDIPNPSIIGGEGIRTPGLFRVNGFQDRRLRPLGHSSKCGGASSRLAMSRQWAFFGFLQLSVDIAGRFGSLRPPFRRCTPHESTRLPPQDVCVFCPFVRGQSRDLGYGSLEAYVGEFVINNKSAIHNKEYPQRFITNFGGIFVVCRLYYSIPNTFNGIFAR